jgi:GNAT superfamily N-acetyltransferase
MGRRLAALTLDTLAHVPQPCRRCVVWELDAVAAARADRDGDPGFEKEAWVSAVLLGWGSCGRVAYVDDEPAGFLMYAPPHAVPRAMAFPTSPVSGDAVVLMGGRVVEAHRGGGLARMLVQGAAKDLSRRGVRAIEAFAIEAPAPGHRRPGRPDAPGDCLVPTDFYAAVGFKVVRPHPRYPRVRLDLRTALSWREDVEQALERILGTVRAPVAAR